ncbi:hypothetical protein BH23ACT2_BH23ACT2_28000 [soil metagenome]
MTAYAQPGADPTNVVGRRIGAFAIDLVILLVIVFTFGVATFSSAAERQEFPTTGAATDECTRINESSDSSVCINFNETTYVLTGDDANGFALQVFGLGTLLGALNLVVLQGLTGASVGKLLVGLRVVREDGRIAHIGWAALRWIVLQIDQICFFLPGAILVFATKGHRRLGDMAASTFVVARRDVGRPVQVPGLNAAWPGAAAQGGWGQQPGGWPQQSPGATQPGAAPSSDGPNWDQARNAYIQYDREQGAWMQWNDGAQQWRPIDQ